MKIKINESTGKEVITIRKEYFELPDDKKINTLNLLGNWMKEQFNNLNKLL